MLQILGEKSVRAALVAFLVLGVILSVFAYAKAQRFKIERLNAQLTDANDRMDKLEADLARANDARVRADAATLRYTMRSDSARSDHDEFVNQIETAKKADSEVCDWADRELPVAFRGMLDAACNVARGGDKTAADAPAAL